MRDTVTSLLQIHKRHADWLGKFSCLLQYPRKIIELIQFHGQGKNYIAPLESKVQLTTDIPRELEDCDPLVVKKHHPVSTLEKGDYHACLPL